MGIVRLFDVQNGKVVPTEHCYTIKNLKVVMDEWTDEAEHCKVYAFLFYMTCPNKDINPFFNVPEEDKEQVVMEEVDADFFSTEDDIIVNALATCTRIYSTPTERLYKNFKKMIDNLANYMGNTPISHGKDGNLPALISAGKNFDDLRQSFKGVEKDLEEEQQTIVRGGQQLAYDL